LTNSRRYARLSDAYNIASSFDVQDMRRDEALAAGADEYLPGDELRDRLVPLVLRHERRRDKKA